MNSLKSLIWPLSEVHHKGQFGRLAVIGGCLEYTGAPYYAAMATLMGGGEISHIFCSKSAANPIKCYSPAIIVHPLLPDAFEVPDIAKIRSEIDGWAPVIHACILGPGLGRSEAISRCYRQFIESFSNEQIIVIDADGLWYLSDKELSMILHMKPVILTPNFREFQSLCSIYLPEVTIESLTKEASHCNEDKLLNCDPIEWSVPLQDQRVKYLVNLSQVLGNVTILLKGRYDIITDGRNAVIVREQGSGRRIGGIGDVLAGLIGLYSSWCLRKKDLNSEISPLIKGIALACLVTKRASHLAEQEYGYSMLPTHILNKINQSLQSILNDKS